MKKLLLIAVAMIVTMSAIAQTQYTFSVSNDTYTNLTNPISSLI